MLLHESLPDDARYADLLDEIASHTPEHIAFLRRKGCSHHDSEDIVQNALLNYMRSIRTFDLSRPWRQWFHQVLHNASKDFFRKSRSRPVTLETDVNIHGNALSVIMESAHVADVREEVADLLHRMSVRTACAMRLHYLEGVPYNEVGSLMGLSPITVRGYVHRTLHSLRERGQAV